MTIALLVCSQAHAEHARASKLMPEIASAMTAPQQACQRAITTAEVAYGVPAGFLLAIGRVESGRLDAQSGAVQPWPWTIDIGGRGSFFATRSEAIAAVAAAQDSGTQSIDVGCMQINLQQHPAAFATLDDAFDPATNARYAARFLVDLRLESGDWVSAAGLYHSRTEALAAPYREAVAMRYGGVATLPLSHAPRPVDMLAAAWASTLGRRGANAAPLSLWPKPPPVTRSTAVHPVQALRLSSR